LSHPGLEGDTMTAATEPTARRVRIHHWRQWLVVVAVAIAVAVVLRLFVVQTFYIPSVSMSPTLKVGDRIIVDKLAYHLHGVGRGDIIVFKAPSAVAAACRTTDTILVKRVIALPGETISDRNGTVYIDGKPLAQPWLSKNDPTSFTGAFSPVHVAANNYFVMGDNRVDSCDSRFWGTVSRSLIIGKADARIWPITRITIF